MLRVHQSGFCPGAFFMQELIVLEIYHTFEVNPDSGCAQLRKTQNKVYPKWNLAAP